MEKTFRLLRKIVNAITILGTMVCVFVNFDIVTCCFSWFSVEPTMAINARYHNFLEKLYGREKARDLEYKIVDWTVDIIENGVNKKLCFIISIMITFSILLGIKDNSKANKRLRVYYIAFLMFVLFVTFWGPWHYYRYTFE